jgi:hypothetical protein
MQNKILIPILLLAVFSIFLIGKGITGLVVSESCCFPPDCAPENICDQARNEMPSPHTFEIASGITMLIGVIFLSRMTNVSKNI